MDRQSINHCKRLDIYLLSQSPLHFNREILDGLNRRGIACEALRKSITLTILLILSYGFTEISTICTQISVFDSLADKSNHKKSYLNTMIYCR